LALRSDALSDTEVASNVPSKLTRSVLIGLETIVTDEGWNAACGAATLASIFVLLLIASLAGTHIELLRLVGSLLAFLPWRRVRKPL